MKTTLLLATALLSASILVPAASAGFADDYAPAPAVCDINDPPVDYVLCLLGDPDPKQIIDRVKSELAWQQTTAVAAANYYNGVGNAVVSSTFDFEGRQFTYTVVLVHLTQSNTYWFVDYVDGVPFRAVGYANGVVEGECRFWVSAGGCPVWATSRDSAGSSLLEGTCDINQPVLSYVVCRANEAYYEVMALAARFQGHYTAVANGAVSYTLVTGLTAYAYTASYVLIEAFYGLDYGLDTAFSGLAYVNDVSADTAGVPGYTSGLVSAECGRVWSGCPYLVVDIAPLPVVLA